jgi:hypothetical protein
MGYSSVLSTLTYLDKGNIMDSAIVDNRLIEQKDHLLMLSSVDELEAIQEGCACLRFVSRLWCACDYGYKVGEVKRRLQDSIERVRQIKGLRPSERFTLDNCENALADCVETN